MFETKETKKTRETKETNQEVAMLSIRTITTLTALVLGFISLVGAEEGESKIEPKLIYERRFDFEIEQGKIGDDGSLFPTIFVTKDNRVLFLNKDGNVHKTLFFNWPNYIAKISDDGKNVIIMTPLNQEKNEFTVKIYDTSGRAVVQKNLSFNYGKPVDIFLTKGAKDVIIFFAGGDLVEPCGIGFYDGKLNLSKLYTKRDFERPLVPGSYWRNPGPNFAWLSKNNQYLAGIGSNIESFGLYVFDIEGQIIISRYFDTLALGKLMTSDDAQIVVCIAYDSYKKILSQKAQNIASYILLLGKNEVMQITDFIKNVRYSEISKMNLVFAPKAYYFAIAAGDSLFRYDTKSHKMDIYANLKIGKLSVLDCFDDGTILITSDNNYLILIEGNGEISIKYHLNNPIVDVYLQSTRDRINVLTLSEVLVVQKEQR